MGNSKMRQIEAKIQKDFRSQIKFTDSFFGEVTLVQEVSTKKKYVKIEKMYGIDRKLKIKNYLKLRQKNSFLVPLKEYFSYETDLCSGTENFVFIFQCNKEDDAKKDLNISLNKNISDRKVDFTDEEIWRLFQEIVWLTKQRREKQYNQIYSNHLIQYREDIENNKLQVIQPFFTSFPEINSVRITCQQMINSKIYVPPQVLELILQREQEKAYTQLQEESSEVYVLGLNFVEIILQKDICDFLYFGLRKKEGNQEEQLKKDTFIKRVNKLLQEIKKSKNEYYLLIRSLLHQNKEIRSSFDNMQDLIKMKLKRHWISSRNFSELPVLIK